MALIRAPAAPERRVRRATAGEGGDSCIHAVEFRRARFFHVRRQAWFVRPIVKLELLFERGVALDDVLAEVGEELLRRHGLERVAIEVGAQITIEALAADDAFRGVQEERAFIIDDGAAAFASIAFADQVQTLAVCRNGGERFLDACPFQRARHLNALGAVNDF